MRGSFVVCAITISSAVSAFPQACPESTKAGSALPSEIRSLEGQLIYHDGIRQWFELRLDAPQCGQASIQLVPAEDRSQTPMEVFRGCRVRSRGAINSSDTAYLSLDMYQNVQAIEPIGACHRQAPFPDSSKVHPEKTIRAYRVDMRFNYARDHPIVFHVTSAGRELRPWQAYASYLLTGGFVLYGHCADGFVIDQVFGTPAAHPGHADVPHSSRDMAMFDPESAAAAGKKDLSLGYTCVRNQ